MRFDQGMGEMRMSGHVRVWSLAKEFEGWDPLDNTTSLLVGCMMTDYEMVDGCRRIRMRLRSPVYVAS